jgi:perosamine synthetase
LYNNCKVVFADIDEHTLCMDWNDALGKITDQTGSILPVHYGGRTSQFTTNFDFPVIQDCAHALGNKEIGTQGTSCWSFHAVKNLATGDGGMITTNDVKIAERLRALRWCGIDKSTWDRSQKKYGWDYSIDEVGYKAHMNDITAALGLAQLERIEDLNNKRKLRVLQYLYELKNLEWLQLPAYDETSSWHLFVVRMEQRNKFIDYMLAHGISVGVHYKPLNTYSIFPNTELPVTDRVWKELVTLPLFPDMTNEEFKFIIQVITKYNGH